MTELLAAAALGEFARALRTGQREPTAALDSVRERFEAVEPTVQAFVDEPNWGRLAAELDDLGTRHGSPGGRPPLYGVPVGIKDIFHVDGHPTRAGASVPEETIAGPQGSAVDALEAAGAIVLGKTVTAEFAHFEPGPTRNPHAPEHTPGGSSSGSAAAVAAGLCPLALGTQTIGSVTRPAAFCGIVGVKPSYGRIPTDGVFPAAPSVDTVGYFTQDLDGARLAGSVLCEHWRDGTDPEALETIGVVDGPYLDSASDEGRAQFRSHVGELDAAGFDVYRIELFPDIETVNERHERLVAAEMALSHGELYPEYGDQYAEQTAALIEEGQSVSVGRLSEDRAGRGELRRAIHDRMDEHGLDVVVSPAAPGPAPETLDSTGDPIMNLPWTHAGVPTVTVPASTTDDGLPLGLQCATRFGDDERLLRWSQQIRATLDQ
ncbi:amidase [Halovenus sp. WSH3]|uniref:Amidase n=1 Tax=Halovenus carboxidivorans TaxID=2692199 RepID=A0A6B0T9C8_9EURY|nr:amidase [Halovenus carboxidivorans]MXR52173.1 amidase [Halovenus carboxidivorans]